MTNQSDEITDFITTLELTSEAVHPEMIRYQTKMTGEWMASNKFCTTICLFGIAAIGDTPKSAARNWHRKAARIFIQNNIQPSPVFRSKRNLRADTPSQTTKKPADVAKVCIPQGHAKTLFAFVESLDIHKDTSWEKITERMRRNFNIKDPKIALESAKWALTRPTNQPKPRKESTSDG